MRPPQVALLLLAAGLVTDPVAGRTADPTPAAAAPAAVRPDAAHAQPDHLLVSGGHGTEPDGVLTELDGPLTVPDDGVTDWDGEMAGSDGGVTESEPLAVSPATMERVTAAANSRLPCPDECVCFDLTVDCSNRDLTRVPAGLPNWTQVLDLHDNLLQTLSQDALSQLPDLRLINVNSNERLAVERDAFAANMLLREIDLGGCAMGEVPLLDLPPSVRVVKLNSNGIRRLDRAAMASLRHVHELDLSHNRLNRLTQHTFAPGTQLRTLNLHNNRITSLKLGRLHNLDHLLVLRLSKNRISKLGQGRKEARDNRSSRDNKQTFGGPVRLRELDLNKNRLTQIDSLVFSGLYSLQVLKLKRNGIRELMDGAFYHLPNMTQLFLDHNSIRNITKGWLYGVWELRHLSLSHNRVRRADRECWKYCEQLTRLNLAYNQLTAVETHTFADLPRLSELVLDHNRIALIEENALRGSPQLRELELNNNLISSTIEDQSGAFSGLTQLRRVGLCHNGIMSVSAQSFAGAVALEEVDLAGNALTTVHEDSFSQLPRLRRLVIDSASLLCDCAVRWLPGWVRAAGHEDTVTARCHHPERLQGRRLMDVPPESLTCQDSPKPSIQQQPRTSKALKGDNLTLSCGAESSANDTMEFGWRKDSQALPAAQAVTLAAAHADGRPGLVMRSELRLANLSDADAGQYQCVVTNRFGVSYSDKATIDVHVFPVFTLRPKNVQLRAGKTAKLECKAHGQPPATISWQKDGGSDFPAARERRMHMLPSEDVFFILHAQPADQGTYTCTARNAAGEIKANATLSVLEVPSFVRPMEDWEVVAGDTAVLNCMASGSPAPRLTWLKDGAPLQATERHFYTAGQQLLIIVQAAPQDAGTYECRLRNVLGEERGNATLTVLPGSSLGLDDDSTYAIIIIAVVSGVVVTSLVWVIIIYHARKRSLRQLRARAAAAAAAERQLSPPPRAVAVFAAGVPSLLERRASSVQLYTGDDSSEHSSGKDSGQGGHDEPVAAADAGAPLVLAVAADSDDEGVGGTPLLERRPRVLTTFQGAPAAAGRESLQTVVPRHLCADRRLARLADGALVTASAHRPTDV